jgi:DNA invertase Pin-like site-specific DNA recombinase
MHMNIAAYCRVSTDTSDQLNSLDAQKRFFNEYTDKNNYHLVKIYADEGISGTKIKNRTEFQRLMRDAQYGLFEMVVVKDISRFARNTVDLLNSTRQLKALGIETMFLTANMTVLGNSEFVLTIFGALAQEESANTSKRVKFGKKLNAEKGRVPNIVYGYDKTPGDYFNLQINEREAAVIRRVYSMYINDGDGAAKIAQRLNAEGQRTKRNCEWSQNAVSRLLTNELYTGKIINSKEEVADFLTSKRKKLDETEWLVTDRPDLRIIEPELFDRAQSVLANRGAAFKTTGERQSNKHLFSTLIKCADCGHSFRRVEKTYRNTFVRWVCSGRNANGVSSCSNRTSIDEAELIEALRAYFTELLSQKSGVVEHVVREFTRTYKAKSDNENYELELQARLSKSQRQRQRYLDMYADELITRDELRSQVSTFNAEIEKCESELRLTSYNLNKGDQLEEILQRTFRTVADVVSMETLTNAQLKQIVEKIVVDFDGGVNIYLKLFGEFGLDETVLISDDRT